MIVGEVIGVSQRDCSSSHDSLHQSVKREDISDNESEIHDRQTPCTLCKRAQEPCSTPARLEIFALSPSECTCNRVFFDLWNACLLTTGGMRLDYGEWEKTCRNHSLDMSEEYPSRRASRAALPSSADPAVGISTFKESALLVARASDTANIIPIVVPIAVVLGLAALGVILGYIYWIKKRRAGDTFGGFLRRRFFHRIPKVHPMTRDQFFEIDQQSENSANTNEFVMVNQEPGFIGFHSWSSMGHLNPRQPEYQFPFRNVWGNTHVMQQFRRIPDIVPLPWGSHPVHIRPSKPNRRFRVDPSGSTEESGSSAMISQQSTVEGGMPGIPEDGDEQEVASFYHSVNEEDEESSLIPDSERAENEVFLISNRNTFTISTNSHSSNSHHFKIIPPTPTESSRSHGDLTQMIPLTTQIRRPFDIPPAPQRPAPVPPSSFTRRPSPLHHQAEPSVYQSSYNKTLFSKNDLPQTKVVPQPPNPPRSVSPSQGGTQRFAPLTTQTVPTLTQPSPKSPNLTIPLRTVTPSQPGLPPPAGAIAAPPQLAPSKPYNVQRRPSAEGNDHPNHNQVPRRPMGARLPSSHSARRPSIDDEASRFGPAVPSGESILMSPPRPPPRPLTPQHPQSPEARSLSAPGDNAVPPALSPPRPTLHARTLSSESLILPPDDSRRFYPGPVRAGGYNVNLRPDATESLENLHSRPLPRERTH